MLPFRVMSEDLDRVLPHENPESYKWRTYPRDVLPLFVAEMDFQSPGPVRRALRQYIEDGVFGYPRGLHTHDIHELLDLAEVAAERMARRYKWQISPEDVVYISGVVPGLNLACHALAVQDGAVLVQPPVYPPILAAPGNAHLKRQ